MIVYVDTSILVKWYIVEAGSDLVDQYLTSAAEVGVAAITLPEAVAAISKKVRRGDIATAEGSDAVNELITAWPHFRKVPISDALIERARELAWDYNLRGYDAVQLAAALIFQGLAGTAIIVAANDDELRSACTAVGLAIWPSDPAVIRQRPQPAPGTPLTPYHFDRLAASAAPPQAT